MGTMCRARSPGGAHERQATDAADSARAMGPVLGMREASWGR
jgi:hypothetical protein